MFRNYLKIAWRNLVRNKTFSLINILGLALGMASSLLILLWVQDELSFDRFHQQDSRVLSVSTSGYLPAGPSNNNNFFAYPDDQATQLVKTLRHDIDDQYVPTLGKGGRNFSPAFATDSSTAILNKTATAGFRL